MRHKFDIEEMYKNQLRNPENIPDLLANAYNIAVAGAVISIDITFITNDCCLLIALDLERYWMSL